jgi:hypothetical protein
MRADTHGALRSPYNFSYLRVWALLKPVKLYHLALARRKLLQGDVEELRALAELQGHEIRLRCGLRVDLEGGHLAPFRPAPVLADEVHRDRHDPWSQLRAAPEIVPRAVKPEKRLLHDFFSQLVVAKVPPREAEEDRRVPLEQEPEGRIVAIDVGPHQFFVGGLGAW